MEQFKYASTDAFNTIKDNSRIDMNTLLGANADYDRVMEEYAQALGLTPEEYQNEGKKVTQTAKNKMFDWAKAVSTNTTYKNNKGVAITPKTPYNAKTIKDNKANSITLGRIVKGNDFGAKVASRSYDIDKQIKSTKKTTTKPKTTVVKKKAPIKPKYESQVEDKVKKQVKKTVSNVKKGIVKLFGNKAKPKAKSKPKPKVKPKANNRR